MPQGWLYAWLFTNAHINQAGMIDVSETTILSETKIGPEDLRAFLEKFEADGKIVRHGAIVWVVNFAKYQTTKSPKLRRRIEKDLEILGPTHPLVLAFLDHHPFILNPQDEEEEKGEEKKEMKGKERKGKIAMVCDTLSDTLSDTVSTRGRRRA